MGYLDMLGQIKNRVERSVEKYAHITDLDKMWEDGQLHQKEIGELRENTKQLGASIEEQERLLAELKEEQKADADRLRKDVLREGEKSSVALGGQINDLSRKLDGQAQTLSSTRQSLTKLSGMKHLYEVDETWEEVHRTSENVEEIRTKTQECLDSIEESSKTMDKLIEKMKKMDELTHLEDVDAMYSDSAALKKDVRSLLESRKELELQNSDLLGRVEETERNISGKIKKAYLLSGLAIALAVVQMVLLVMGVL